jgi:hypothetical protein
VATQTATSDPDVDAAPAPAPDGSRAQLGDWLIVTSACLVVAAALAPELVLRDSMPLGSDLTGHPVVSWFDREHPLAFLPGSWSDDAFNGFPVNQLYPWLPSWLIGMASLVLPLSVAVKLGVVLPLVALPWAAWRAGSWSGLPRPLPAMLSVATLPFLFDASCGSCGGTIYSAVAGEYAFAWALAFGVLALGAVDRLAASGRGWILAALLASAAALSHPLPALWLLVGIVCVGIGREVWSDREVAQRFAASAVVAALLAASWWIPFATTRAWAPDNPLVRDGSTLEWLLPASQPWEIAVLALAVAGAVRAVARREWLLVAFGVQALVALVAFVRFTDGGPFYSIRVLPFVNLGRWMLAAAGGAWLVHVVVSRLRANRGAATDPRIAPVVWLMATVLVVGSTWGWWGVVAPATATTNGSASILGIQVPVTSVSTSVRTTFAGFAARGDYPQLLAVQDFIRAVGQRYGCGTMMWDNGDPAAEAGPAFGDPQVFWQVPIWTDGCIRSADGVLVDSSMTAPGMAMTKSLVSQATEPLLPGRPEYAVNIEQGADRMQALGVRYYLTQGGAPAEAAATTPLLRLLGNVGPWQMWQVGSGAQVTSLESLPAVFEPALDDRDWEAVSNRYFSAPTYTTVPLAQDGPGTWPRAGLSALPVASAVPAAGVTDIRSTDDRISFTVARPGSPVVVRVSAFPGWVVDGAEGPYRATPNYLVVVPTSSSVTLSKQRTATDWLGIAAGLAGLAILTSVAVFRVLERRGTERLLDDAVDEPLAGADPDVGSDDVHPPARNASV